MDLSERLNFIISVVDRSSAQIENINRSFRGLGDRAVRTAAVIGGAFASGFGLKAALDASVVFEKGLIGVGKTAGISGQALTGIGEAIKALSLRIPVATDELLSIAEAAGSVGVTGQQNILKFTETIAKLGRASDLAGGEAATTLARLLNVTNESAGTVDKLAAVIVALGNAFPATEKEIAHMAGEVARASAIFGVSSAQAAALGTALASIGVQAELGGSAVGKTMREMDNAIRSGGTAFADLQLLTNMTGEQLKKSFKDDAVGVFTAFLAGLDKVRVGGGSAAQELEKFNLKGDEILKVLPALAANSTMLGEALRVAAAEASNATALNEEFSSSAKSLDSELNLLSNTFDVVNRRVGDQFAPAVRQLSETLREVGEHGSSLNSLLAVFSALASATISVAGFVAKWGGEIATVVTIVAGAKILGWARAIASVGAESTLAAIAAGRLGDAFRAFGAGLLVPFATLPTLLRTAAVAMGELATSALVAALNFGLISTAVAGIGIYKLVEFLGLMWEAAKATDEVEARAKDADDAYKALAAKTQELAKAMEEAFGGDIAKQMSFISGLSEKQLGQTRELLRAKLAYIETERARLELEQATLQQEALTKQEIAAKKAAKAQAEQNAQLRNNLQSITVTIEKLVTKLEQGFIIDIDTKSANSSLETFKTATEKTGLTLKAQVDSRDAKTKLDDLALPIKKSLVVEPDLSLYKLAVKIIKQPTSSQHTIHISYSYGYRSGGLVDPVGYRSGGLIRPLARFADGGLLSLSQFVPRSGQIPGWDPARVDKVPALLTLGEFVTNALSVRILNQAFPGFMAMLNSIRTLGQARDMLSGLRGFRTGGMVTNVSNAVVQHYSTGGLVSAGAAPAADAGGQLFQFAPVFHIQGGSAPDMERVFRESIIPSLKNALRDNASGITTAMRRELGRG